MIKRLFDNPGGKIKAVVTILFVIMTIGMVLLGILNIVAGAEVANQGNAGEGVKAIITGIVEIILSPIVSWLSCIILYAFGELVENSSKGVKRDVQSLKAMVNEIRGKNKVKPQEENKE